MTQPYNVIDRENSNFKTICYRIIHLAFHLELVKTQTMSKITRRKCIQKEK